MVNTLSYSLDNRSLTFTSPDQDSEGELFTGSSEAFTVSTTLSDDGHSFELYGLDVAGNLRFTRN